MNYRHAFHAGNFADVLKHAVLAQCLERLTAKDKPFAVVDSHAGLAWYDLASDEARRSPEWREGIGRLWNAAVPDAVAPALAPYLDAVRGANPDGALRWYPGSPALAAGIARGQDRLRLCELHPDDVRRLRDHFEGDARATVTQGDGYAALKRLLPPPEKRGLALIDPPFEHVDEMAHMAQAAVDGLTRWPTGTFVFWRPLKDIWAAERFDVGLAEWLIAERELPAEKILRADLWVRELGGEGPLAGAGVVVVNPAYQLDEKLAVLLPWLAELLAQGDGAGWRLDGAITESSLLVDEF